MNKRSLVLPGASFSAIFATLLALALSALADPIEKCIPGSTKLTISRKPGLPEAQGIASGTDFAPIVTTGKSYLGTGGVPLNIQNPPLDAKDIPSILARHIGNIKARNLVALKAQYQAVDHAKIDSFLANPDVAAGFWASGQAIQSARLLLVRAVGEYIEAWVERTDSSGTKDCGQYTLRCAQGQLYMAVEPDASPAGQDEDFKLIGFLFNYGINGVTVVEQ